MIKRNLSCKGSPQHSDSVWAVADCGRMAPFTIAAVWSIGAFYGFVARFSTIRTGLLGGAISCIMIESPAVEALPSF